MSNNPKYTVAICNYNMADTLEESLRSVLDQLEGDRRFEVLVVDDGSTDGSQEILDKLEEEYKILRWIEGNNNNLAEARNFSFEKAKGEYILESIDTDDKYEPIIKDFVKIYHFIEQEKEDFWLDGNNINMATRNLLLEHNYRSLGYGEDLELGSRLEADDRMVSIDHNSVSESIGYTAGFLGKHKITFEFAVTNFRSGVSYWSYFKWRLKNFWHFEHYFQFLASPIAYLIALKKGRYEAPEGFEDMGKYKTGGVDTLTLRELENKYNLEFDKDELSELGKEKFLVEKE